MTATIRVRVNPADRDEYVIYAVPVTGWEWNYDVADWPESELAIPDAAQSAGSSA